MMRPFARTGSAVLSLLLVTFLAPHVAAAQKITVSGQVRPRSELRDPSGAAGGSQSYTSLRTRIGALYQAQGPVRAFVQFQDVRFFGEELGTLSDFDADNQDLHQGWLEVGTENSTLALRVGRQEANYGEERLVGAVDWTQQGRAFDGARLRVNADERLTVDVLGFQLAESAAPTQFEDASFWGAYGVYQAGAGRTLDAYALWRYNASDGGDTDQWTSGLRYAASDGGFNYRVEGAWQTGERVGSDVSAWLLAAQVGRDFHQGRAGVTLWLDYLSGNDPGSDEVGVFETLFATNHKFYGFADLFTDIPLHTAGRGLVDMAVKGRWQVHPDWRLNLDLHRFTVAEDDGLADDHLGTEVDLTLTRSLFYGLRVSGGASYVFEGDALLPVRGIGEDVQFVYVMLDLVF
ncbi:MAG: alginate export family protein [Longimicrobiales bacterium]|nr:alginate export family protein [Longimicrobiales bacterium]